MLDDAEQRRTSDELLANLRLTGLTHAEVAGDLRFDAPRLAAALAVDHADPVDVWQLRDYLDRAVRDAGREPIAWTVLTAGNKVRARMWFRLRKAPRHAFLAA